MSIILTALNKRYGQNPVVNNVSLTIGEGELFVLLGSSGSGKSTILRLIAGLADLDSGRIELNGRDVTHLPTQARNVGFVFQNYSLFPHMTVNENIEFGLEVQKVPRKERRQRSTELLELVHLAGFGQRYPTQLSGGQQQRVALARALAHKPEVLLLDEPFGALDVKIRSQLRESLRDVQRQLHVTSILVTHDQEEAFELADHIGLLERGSLVEVGTPEELYHCPKTEHAAVFVGGGNVLVGRRNDGQIELGALTLPLPASAPAHDPGAPVRILFRPETIRLQKAAFRKKDGLHVLGQGKIVSHTFTGAAHRVRIEINGLRGVRTLAPQPIYGQHNTHLDAAVPSTAGEGISIAVGQEMWVGISEYHVLSPAGLKILICYHEAGSGAVAFGLRLAEAARGPATLLAITPQAEAVAPLREILGAIPHQWGAEDNPHLVTLVRQGDIPMEILREAQEGHYEVVILGRSPRKPDGLGRTGRRILAEAEVPVMLVKEPRERIEHILICTAAGEPGKGVVLFGGRVARRAGAAATVLHVLGPKATSREQAYSKAYLDQAQTTLDALGVDARVKLEQGSTVDRILAEADTNDVDLLVIGAPAPRVRKQLRGTDLAAHIVTKTDRPVVVVPMRG